MRKLFFIQICIWSSLCLAAPLKITIDPGHGGEDQGAAHGGIKESNVALQISKKLFQRLKKDRNFRVQMTRHKDHEVSLEDRVDQSKKYKPDLFLSIHANAHPTLNAKGTEFYIQNQLEADEETAYLAHTEFSSHMKEEKKPRGDIESIFFDLQKSQRILESYQVSSFMRKNWPKKKRKMIRQGPFFVLTQNDVPSVLIEVGYLTHEKERKKLTKKSYQNQLVRQIHKALKDYAKNMDKLPSGILKTQNAKTR